MSSSSTEVCEDNSPTDSVIGRDFQELSAEEQERQREEWKAELRKTEEEVLTLLKQVLCAKEKHAAGLKRRLQTRNHGLERVLRRYDAGTKKSAGLRHVQEDSGEYSNCQRDCEGEDFGDGGGHHCLGLLPEYVLCLRSGQDQDLQLCVPAVIQRRVEGA